MIHTELVVHPAPYRLFLFDADDTLRHCTVDGQPCPNTQDEWVLRPYVWDTMRNYYNDPKDPRYLGIASNQDGVRLGYLSADTAYELLCDLAHELEKASPHILGLVVRCCTDREKDPLRYKPAPGMLLEIMQFFQVKPSETLYVGDMPNDFHAAQNAGCDFAWAGLFFYDDIPF